MVFQNPSDTLNPSHTIGGQIGRVIKKFGVESDKEKIRHRVPDRLGGGSDMGTYARWRDGLTKKVAGARSGRWRLGRQATGLGEECPVVAHVDV